MKQFFLHKGWPDLVPAAAYINALNFVLGVHPGASTASFASGVGAQSATVAYGFNRADWSYIPGGVVSDTALIRPDLPELKRWPCRRSITRGGARQIGIIYANTANGDCRFRSDAG